MASLPFMHRQAGGHSLSGFRNYVEHPFKFAPGHKFYLLYDGTWKDFDGKNYLFKIYVMKGTLPRRFTLRESHWLSRLYDHFSLKRTEQTPHLTPYELAKIALHDPQAKISQKTCENCHRYSLGL